MLPRLTIGFIALSAAVAIAACSSYGAGTTVDVGPNFPPMTLYASNSNQNAISIYNKGQKTGTGPAFEIGGANTTLNGPQYLAFDTTQNLWITNYNAATNHALLVEIEALATGDVLPLQSVALGGHLRGIAISTKSTVKGFTPLMVISDVIPTSKYPSQLLLFAAGATAPYQSIAGPKPALRVPGGVALDSKNDIYVANVQGAKVQQFVLPTPSPTPSTTPSPSPTPKPTPTPTGSPTSSPTPSPTPTPINIVARITIAGPNTHVVTPTSVAVDDAGNIYVSDQGTLGKKSTAGILVFAPPKNKGLINVAPIRWIHGSATQLTTPTDVKVDAKTGFIYVADSAHVLVFKITDNGNQAPLATYNSPGAVTGLGLVP
ncbi:MAG TPA: hypothetical protein VJP76_02190 [Candidatus Tumulicola sp.]|nr:hypothetical protein [Candidatus Tumulicola sp.]